MNRFPENDIISLVDAPVRYELGESTGPDLRLADLVDAVALGELPLGYGSAAGDPALRAAIAAVHGAAPSEVIVTAGGMQALFLIAFILCARGDEAVIAKPCFPLARNALAAVGADIRALPLSFDDGYRLDPHRLRAVLSPRTKLVSLASPQNPSGVAISPAALRDALQAMHDICPGAYLLVDETYREAVYGDDPIADTAVTRGLSRSPRCRNAMARQGCGSAGRSPATPRCAGSWWSASSTRPFPARALTRRWRSGSSSAARRSSPNAVSCSMPACNAPPPGCAQTAIMSNGYALMPARYAVCA